MRIFLVTIFGNVEISCGRNNVNEITMINKMRGIYPPENKSSNDEDYTRILKFFEDFNNSKQIIYYEDLIGDLRSELKKLVIFFSKFDISIENEIIDHFICDYEYHKNICLVNYEKNIIKPNTNGNSCDYYSQFLTQEQQTTIKKYLFDNFKHLSNKYLDRYFQ